MAIKYYCDGCDKQVPYDLIQKVSVSIRPTGQVTQAGGEYELCKRCFDTLLSGSNPKSWPRCGGVAA